jgi:hypothetical protein
MKATDDGADALDGARCPDAEGAVDDAAMQEPCDVQVHDGATVRLLERDASRGEAADRERFDAVLADALAMQFGEELLGRLVGGGGARWTVEEHRRVLLLRADEDG